MTSQSPALDSRTDRRFFAGVLSMAAVLALWALPGNAQPPDDDAAPPSAEPQDAAPTVAELPRPPDEPQTLASKLDSLFADYVVAPLFSFLFWDLVFWDDNARGGLELPAIVAWLVFGALFFTLRMQFINLRAFRHAVDVTLGRYDRPEDVGEVSHFQALASALSATVGLGNIAGVAIAVGTGGPGAVFWMVVAGFLGMSSKFTECTLGQVYRVVDKDGQVSGGPMRYLSAGLSARGLPRLGKFLAALFALMCIGGSFGGGNMF